MQFVTYTSQCRYMAAAWNTLSGNSRKKIDQKIIIAKVIDNWISCNISYYSRLPIFQNKRGRVFIKNKITLIFKMEAATHWIGYAKIKI